MRKGIKRHVLIKKLKEREEYYKNKRVLKEQADEFNVDPPKDTGGPGPDGPGPPGPGPGPGGITNLQDPNKVVGDFMGVQTQVATWKIINTVNVTDYSGYYNLIPEDESEPLGEYNSNESPWNGFNAVNEAPPCNDSGRLAAPKAALSNRDPQAVARRKIKAKRMRR